MFERRAIERETLESKERRKCISWASIGNAAMKRGSQLRRYNEEKRYRNDKGNSFWDKTTEEKIIGIVRSYYLGLRL